MKRNKYKKQTKYIKKNTSKIRLINNMFVLGEYKTNSLPLAYQYAKTKTQFVELISN